MNIDPVRLTDHMSALNWPANHSAVCYQGTGTAVRLSDGSLEFFIICKDRDQLLKALAFIDNIPTDAQRIYAIEVRERATT